MFGQDSTRLLRSRKIFRYRFIETLYRRRLLRALARVRNIKNYCSPGALFLSLSLSHSFFLFLREEKEQNCFQRYFADERAARPSASEKGRLSEATATKPSIADRVSSEASKTRKKPACARCAEPLVSRLAAAAPHRRRRVGYRYLLASRRTIGRARVIAGPGRNSRPPPVRRRILRATCHLSNGHGYPARYSFVSDIIARTVNWLSREYFCSVCRANVV